MGERVAPSAHGSWTGDECLAHVCVSHHDERRSERKGGDGANVRGSCKQCMLLLACARRCDDEAGLQMQVRLDAGAGEVRGRGGATNRFTPWVGGRLTGGLGKICDVCCEGLFAVI